MASLTQLQNFYKTTLTIAVPLSTSIGNFYVAILPTVSSGYLVMSASNSTKREIIYYSATGTDATGPYVTIPNTASRGMGGTTAQAHDKDESIRMNVTAQHWADMTTEVLTNIPASIASVVASVANKADKITNNAFFGVNTFAISPQIPAPTSSSDAVNLAYVLGLAFGGVVAQGFNKATITLDSQGRIKSVRDNELGIPYLISYDSQDNPVKIYNGVNTWRFIYTGDNLSSITKV